VALQLAGVRKLVFPIFAMDRIIQGVCALKENPERLRR